jgi:hypothetical protein
MANLNQISIPSTNQPIDYDMLNTIVSTINNLVTSVSENIANSDSTIFGTPVASNKVKVLAQSYQVSENNSKVDTISTIQVSFGQATFKVAPFVTVTPKSANSTNFAACSYFISNLTSTGCTINIKFAVATKIAMSFDVLAIGVPA